MKKFIVDTGKKKYIVKATDAEHAVKLIKKVDSVKDEAFVIEVYWRGAKITGEKRQWLVGKMATTDLNQADKFTSAQQAKEVIRFQNIGNHARVVRMSSIRDNENRRIKDAGLSVYHYKSSISSRQTVQIQKDGREIYSFETAAEAIAFANKILSIAAKLPK